MDKDDLWIVEHFSELVTKYAGKYVAVVNEQLVAVGNSGKEVEDKAREIEPRKKPSVLRVSREEDLHEQAFLKTALYITLNTYSLNVNNTPSLWSKTKHPLFHMYEVSFASVYSEVHLLPVLQEKPSNNRNNHP